MTSVNTRSKQLQNSCRVNNSRTNKQKATAVDKQRYSRETDGELGVCGEEVKRHIHLRVINGFQQRAHMYVGLRGPEAQQQCTLSSIKVWQKKVGEVHKMN